jgi:hypothetical protein
LHTTVLQQPFVATAVTVSHATRDHVGDGLKPAMWVVGKASDVFARVVAAKGIEHEKWVKPLL